MFSDPFAFGIKWMVEIKIGTVCWARWVFEMVDEKEGLEDVLGWRHGRSSRMDCTRGDFIPG